MSVEIVKRKVGLAPFKRPQLVFDEIEDVKVEDFFESTKIAGKSSVGDDQHFYFTVVLSNDEDL